jgi:hypothetical protein
MFCGKGRFGFSVSAHNKASFADKDLVARKCRLQKKERAMKDFSCTQIIKARQRTQLCRHNGSSSSCCRGWIEKASPYNGVFSLSPPFIKSLNCFWHTAKKKGQESVKSFFHFLSSFDDPLIIIQESKIIAKGVEEVLPWKLSLQEQVINLSLNYDNPANIRLG